MVTSASLYGTSFQYRERDRLVACEVGASVVIAGS